MSENWNSQNNKNVIAIENRNRKSQNHREFTYLQHGGNNLLRAYSIKIRIILF